MVSVFNVERRAKIVLPHRSVLIAWMDSTFNLHPVFNVPVLAKSALQAHPALVAYLVTTYPVLHARHVHHLVMCAHHHLSVKGAYLDIT